MPDGSNLTPATRKKPEMNAEERANRLHALLVSLAHMDPNVLNLNLPDDEAENVRGNLLNLALDESRALLATDGFR
jgi:hypothetical protein